MSMKRIMLVMIILLSFPVLADFENYQTCKINTNCSVNSFVVNNTNPIQFLNASGNCTITLYNSTDYTQKLLNNATMSLITTGFYSYNVSLSQTGLHPAYIQCGGTDIDDTKEVSIIGTISDSWSIGIILTLLGIIGILTYLSLKLENIHYPIKLLMFTITFALLIVTVNVGRLIVEEQSPTSTNIISMLDTVHFALIFIFLFLLAYLIIYYMVELFQAMGKANMGKTK